MRAEHEDGLSIGVAGWTGGRVFPLPHALSPNRTEVKAPLRPPKGVSLTPPSPLAKPRALLVGQVQRSPTSPCSTPCLATTTAPWQS